MGLPIHIQVMMPTTLTIKQAMLIPYTEIKPLRDWFDLDKLNAFNADRKFGNGSKGDFLQLKRWATNYSVKEMHFNCASWNNLKETRITQLSDPRFKTALYFVAGKNFNLITGHPTGTELLLIDNQIYRRLTWRSITIDRFNKKIQNDAGVTWRTQDEFVYFLYKCEKINEEPLKSSIVDAVGGELLERDRPKILQER